MVPLAGGIIASPHFNFSCIPSAHNTRKIKNITPAFVILGLDPRIQVCGVASEREPYPSNHRFYYWGLITTNQGNAMDTGLRRYDD